MEPLLLVTGGTGIAAALLSWGMAGFVYVAGSSRIENRLAALFLLLVGIQVGTTFGIEQLVGSSAGWEGMAVVAHLSQSFVYLALLGTLDSPLSRPFRGRAARVALLALALAPALAWPWLSPLVFDHSPGGTYGSLYFPLLFAHGLALLFGFFVALSAWRRAAIGSASHARSRAFTYAFGVRDVVFFLGITISSLNAELLAPGTIPAWYGTAQDFFIPLSVVVMVLLMAYGIARLQLFDVDVKLRIGVRRGTLAAVFVAVFLVASQLVEALTSESFGLVGGALASGLLLFALTPLQRAAERVSSTVLPRAEPLATRPQDERVALYREQVRLAWEDGQMGLKERRMLDVARDRLGLSAEAATALEREVVQGASRTTAG